MRAREKVHVRLLANNRPFGDLNRPQVIVIALPNSQLLPIGNRPGLGLAICSRSGDASSIAADRKCVDRRTML